MIQALMSRILTLKINQGTKFGTLEIKPMCNLFDVNMCIFFLSYDRLPWIIVFPRIITPFWCENLIILPLAII